MTFNLNDTFIGGYRYIAVLNDSIPQGGTTTVAGAVYERSPTGPISFYLQPPDLQSSFDCSFLLFPDALTDAGGPNAGSSDFYNTASLASVQALDANGNVLPDVNLELEDGTLLGPNGFTAASSEIPEPGSLILLVLAHFLCWVLSGIRNVRQDAGDPARLDM